MTRFRGVEWAVGLILLSIFGAALGQYFEAPRLYVTGILQHNSSLPNVISTNCTSSTIELEVVSPNSNFFGWSFPNITFVTMQTISGAMVLGNTQISTFGFAPLTGQNILTNCSLTPRLLADFAPHFVKSVLSTDTFSVALISNGSVYVWGSSDRHKFIPNYSSEDTTTGFLGFENTVDAFSIRKIVFPGNTQPIITKIFTGTAYHTFAIDSENQLWGWGYSQHVLPTSQGSMVVSVPTLLQGFDNFKGEIVQISSENHAVALLKNGSYICWGIVSGNACGNGSFISPNLNPSALPEIIQNPASRTWVKMATGRGFTYAIADDGTLWAWGIQKNDMTYAPIQDNDACKVADIITWCEAHQVILAPHRRNAKIVDILDSYFFIFAMTDLGEIFLISTDLFGESNAPLFWRPFPYSIPNGHALNFSRSQTSGNTVFLLTSLSVPCSEPKPSLGNSTSFLCNQGVWVVTDDSVEISTDFSIDSPIVIVGNMTVSSPITITTPVQDNFGKPLLTAENCIQQMENLQFHLQLTGEQLKQSSIDPLLLIEFDQNCAFTTLLQTQITQPNNCRKADVTLQSSTTPSGRTQIHALFSINSSSCNTWWIILVSVLGGVVLLGIFIALLFTFNKNLRDKCRPFAKRSNVGADSPNAVVH